MPLNDGKPVTKPKGLWNSFIRVFTLGLLVGIPIVSSADVKSNTLRIAVASNFAATAKELITPFAAQQGFSVTYSSGSTGALYAQIIHGAPFDLFLSADTHRPRQLDSDGLIVPNSRKTYAQGQLALWDTELTSIAPILTDVNLRALLDNERRLSIANPRTAPYGNAAKELLESLQLWGTMSSVMIQGNTVLQAFQFIQTGNVSRGLVALHLLAPDANVLVIPQDLYTPLEQQMVILAKSNAVPLSKQIQAFLLSAKTQKKLIAMGYKNINQAGH